MMTKRRRYYLVEALRWVDVMVFAKDEQEARECAIRAPGVIQLGAEVRGDNELDGERKRREKAG